MDSGKNTRSKTIEPSQSTTHSHASILRGRFHLLPLEIRPRTPANTNSARKLTSAVTNRTVCIAIFSTDREIAFRTSRDRV